MSDLISRQAAIEAIVTDMVVDGWETMKAYEEGKRGRNAYLEGISDSLAVIRNLPSAQPEIIRCKDCKWWGLSEYNTLGIHICKRFSGMSGESDFCSRAKRSEE